MTLRIIVLVLSWALAQAVLAQDNTLDEDRYSLAETDDGFLRVERDSGRVSLCEKANGTWRCAPVPDAQLALEQEIDTLQEEVERLRARNNELEAKILAISRAAEEALNGLSGDNPVPETGENDRQLSENDEKQIDRALDFTEKAMRRFFGLMKTLREEFEESTK